MWQMSESKAFHWKVNHYRPIDFTCAKRRDRSSFAFKLHYTYTGNGSS